LLKFSGVQPFARTAPLASSCLIDSSNGEIRYTDTDELILDAHWAVNALCPIPLSLAERLVKGRTPK
jgi:hypothetical protein